MSDARAEATITIHELGTFVWEYHFEDDDVPTCATRSIRFRECDGVDLIIYPNDDGSPLRDEQILEFRDRFRRFESRIETALRDLPAALLKWDRERNYLLDERLSDDRVIDDLVFTNVKLYHRGTIECYSRNPIVSHCDIVLQFSPECELEYLHFDG